MNREWGKRIKTPCSYISCFISTSRLTYPGLPPNRLWILLRRFVSKHDNIFCLFPEKTEKPQSRPIIFKCNTSHKLLWIDSHNYDSRFGQFVIISWEVLLSLEVRCSLWFDFWTCDFVKLQEPPSSLGNVNSQQCLVLYLLKQTTNNIFNYLSQIQVDMYKQCKIPLFLSWQGKDKSVEDEGREQEALRFPLDLRDMLLVRGVVLRMCVYVCVCVLCCWWVWVSKQVPSCVLRQCDFISSAVGIVANSYPGTIWLSNKHLLRKTRGEEEKRREDSV